jgi:alpha-L-rhamnosidase
VRIFVAVPLALAFTLLAALLAASANAAPPTVTALSVDQMRNPLGIDDPHPSLGWQLRSGERGTMQAAYRIQVAESAPQLDSEEPEELVWDSGWVDSPESVGVAYSGPTLESRQRYYWRVRVRNERSEESAWSAPSWWEMALLEPSDWHGAEWIAPEAATEASSWTDYRLDVDFTIAAGAAGVVFRAQDQDDFYMWQVKIEDEGEPGEEVLLRPHVRQNGSWRVLEEIDVGDVVEPSHAHEPHHLRIEAEGDTITTYIDGEQVDERTDGTFAGGGVGFRSGDSNEDASFEGLEVHGPDDEELFADDLGTAPDPAFPGAEIESGALRVHGDEMRLISTTPPVPELRKEFELEAGRSLGEVASARIYAFGLGLYELRLSGVRVGDRVLAPPATSYGHRLRYQTYDVTSQLREGENVLGVTLAEGYGPRFSKYGWRWFGPREARVLLDIHYTDGEEQLVHSDDTWRWGEGPVRDASLYDGETYDARLADNWDEPGYDDSSWQPVKAAAPPAGALEADTTPPIRVVETLPPAALTEPQPGVYVFDLGRNVSGWARIHVEGPAGTEVRMRYAENLRADGTLDTTTNRNAAATDTYFLSEDPGEQTFEPEFTYHGFRYVEVTGLPGGFEPTPDTLDGRVVHADLPHTAGFESSDPLLDRIYAGNRRTMENNAMGYPTDNPVRDERTGPGMDVQAYVDAAVRDFDADRYLAGFLDQLDEEWGGSPDMNLAHIPIAWALYEQYGDLATLAGSYASMSAALDNYMSETAATGGVWPEPSPGEHDGFGDWCPPIPAAEVAGGVGGPDIDGYEECFSEVSLVNTALAYRDARIVAAAARALGHGAEASHFDAEAEAIREAFEDEFADEGTGYGSERQVTSILPLAFGMVPEGRRAAVSAALVERVLEHDEGHLDTGIFGTRFLLDALAAAGRPDVALTALDQTSYPGFGYEIEFGPQIGLPSGHGATTDWEEWAYESGKGSHDHAMFAGINASFMTDLAGIEPLSPGYAEVGVAPVAPAGLEHVAASLQTVRGEVASSWRRSGDEFELDVTVPANATAEVTVPTRPGDEVRESGVEAGASEGVSFVRDEGAARVYRTGSGTFHFLAGPAPSEPGEEEETLPSGGGEEHTPDEAPDAAASPPPAPVAPAAPAADTPSLALKTHRRHRHRPRLRLLARAPRPHLLVLVLTCRAACPARPRPARLTVRAANGKSPVLARHPVRLTAGRVRLALHLRRRTPPHRLRVEIRGLGSPVKLIAKVRLSALSSTARAAPGVRPPGRRA